MQLRRVDSAGRADCSDFFAAGYPLPFLYKQAVIVGIGGNPAVVVLNQNQVAETFQFVAGISDRAFVGCLDVGTECGFDVYAVIGAAFADGAEMRNDCTLNRPQKFCLAVFGNGLCLAPGTSGGFLAVVLAEEDDFQLQRLGVVLGVAALYEAVSVLLRLPGSTSRWPMARV